MLINLPASFHSAGRSARPR